MKKPKICPVCREKTYFEMEGEKVKSKPPLASGNCEFCGFVYSSWSTPSLNEQVEMYIKFLKDRKEKIQKILEKAELRKIRLGGMENEKTQNS